ncbi:MAG TPA: BON domain-containing protein [Pseudoxanthomonas sp.]|nr:BON domain-containing protein [Pseudoxanthomonas sp.]
MDKQVGTELKAALSDLQNLAVRVAEMGREWWDNRRDDMNQQHRRYQEAREHGERGYGEGYATSRVAGNSEREEGQAYRGAGGYRENATRGERGPYGPQPGREREYGRGFDETEFYSGAGAETSRAGRARFEDDEAMGEGAYGREYGSAGRTGQSGGQYGQGRNGYRNEDSLSGYSQGRQGYSRRPEQNLGQGSYGQRDYGQGGYDQGNYGRGQESGHGDYPGSGYSGQDHGFTGSRYDTGYAGLGNDYYNERGQAQRMAGYRGRGPKNYRRSDERITEDLNERLTEDSLLDASEINVSVSDGVATLQGTVENRWMKHRAEDIADACSGVKDVRNEIRVSGNLQGRSETTGSMAGSGAKSGGDEQRSQKVPQAPGTTAVGGTTH